jgi:predicted extracellular nuclease
VVDLMVAEHDAGRTHVVALGDFNDTLGSAPLQEFQTRVGGEPLANLFLWHAPRQDRYTFIFAGESEVLDHLIMSAELNDLFRSGGAVHVHADQPDAGPLRNDNCPGSCRFETGHSSGPQLAGHHSPDHDPVCARFGFSTLAAALEEMPASRSFRGPFAQPLRLWYNTLHQALEPCLSLPGGLVNVCIRRAIAR